MKKPTLVVMAAGMGSRFGGLKQMTPIDPQGNSIIQYSLYDARLAGFDKVVFIIKHEIEHDFREKVGRGVEPYFDVSYVFQELTSCLPQGFTVPEGRTKPWGTGPRRAVRARRDRRAVRRHQLRRFLRPRRIHGHRRLPDRAACR